ncbi:MAG: DNA-3-methyladenine glycosylase [Thermoanaerobaculaceae bacterium]
MLVRRLPEGLVAVRLCEVEAYLGVSDPACHTFGGRRTPRTEVMWGEAGRLYVYFTYGLHFCANVVTRLPGEPEAVLLRGGVVLAGAGPVERRRGRRDRLGWLDGPARLCQGLGLGRTENGADLTSGAEVWVADDGTRVPPGSVLRGARVGVAYAGEAAGWPLRLRVEPDAPAGAGARGEGGGAERARRGRGRAAAAR